MLLISSIDRSDQILYKRTKSTRVTAAAAAAASRSVSVVPSADGVGAARTCGPRDGGFGFGWGEGEMSGACPAAAAVSHLAICRRVGGPNGSAAAKCYVTEPRFGTRSACDAPRRPPRQLGRVPVSVAGTSSIKCHAHQGTMARTRGDRVTAVVVEFPAAFPRPSSATSRPFWAGGAVRVR